MWDGTGLCPFKAHGEQNLLPVLGLKHGLELIIIPRKTMCFNLGLLILLEPLPTSHTDVPTEPTEKSVRRAPVRLFLNTGHVILMGNHLAEWFFLNLENEENLGSWPDSKKL